MQISSSMKAPAVRPQADVAKTAPQEKAARATEQEVFTESDQKTPTYKKVGKYALAAVATAGAGAIAYYGGANSGLVATVAGAAGGALAGATVLGGVGLFADIAGGFMSNTNYSEPMAKAGGLLGLGVGGTIGAFAQNSGFALGMGVAAGAAALILTASATNILAD